MSGGRGARRSRRSPARGGRSTAQRRAAAKRAAAKRRARERMKRLRRFVLVVAVLAAGAIALAIWRLDLGDKFEELTLPLRHEEIIRAEADDEDVAHVLGEDIELPPADPALIAAVIFEESKFIDQTSSAGARGLMQITPPTADTIEKLSGGETFVYEDLADPELNIRYGTYFLRYLLDKYDGVEAAALAAYNAGEGNADEWGGKDLDPEAIPFPETRDYVRDVLEKREAYAEKYADELGL